MVEHRLDVTRVVGSIPSAPTDLCRGSSVAERSPEEAGVVSSILTRGTKNIAGIVYRYYATLPRWRNGFNSRYPLYMFFSIFQKMREGIRRKVETDEPGLYIALAFPILIAFILTFAGSRAIGYLITYGIIPELYLEPSPGLHIHHFTYGIFILFAAGYLGLIVKQAKSKFGVALLQGFGFGLAMDEFGMWLRLRDDDVVRWSYDGLTITVGLFLFIFTAKPGFKMLKKLWPAWPFRKTPPML